MSARGKPGGFSGTREAPKVRDVPEFSQFPEQSLGAGRSFREWIFKRSRPFAH